MYQVMNVLLAVFFNPAAGVDEGLEPGGRLIVAAGAGIVAALPREYGAFEVRHHGQVTAIGRADAGDGSD